jgi:hypothetical protein
MGETGYNVNPGECLTMPDQTGCPEMAKKKSETRKHTAMMRVDAEALAIARKAASLMEMSLADYASNLLRTHGSKDIEREAKKFTKGSKE